MTWHVQKACCDIESYELVVEKQKNTFHCEQRSQSWKWAINYHGAQVASGLTNDFEDAKKLAEANVPV
jgi:hypothetical protein